MTNLPRTSAANDTGACTGHWACSVEADGRHCVCVEDATPGRPVECCQCESRGERCIRCAVALTRHDPATTTLGARCARCWVGKPSRC